MILDNTETVSVSSCKNYIEGAKEKVAVSAYNNPAGYERYMGRFSRHLAEKFADFVGIDDQMELLDVGCGTGALTRALLKRSNNVRVTGIDPSKTFLYHAREHVASGRARFLDGDAQDLGFEDGEFDGTMALLTLHNVARPEEALHEMMRVTKRGGVVAVCEWDFYSGVEMMRVIWDAIATVDPAGECKHVRNMPLGRPGQVASLLEAAGLHNIEEISLHIEMPYESFDDFWESLKGSPASSWQHIRMLPPTQVSEIRRLIRRILLKEGTDRPFELGARAWAAKAVII